MQKISQRGLDFIKGFESFVPYVYDDLVPARKGKYAEWDGGPVKGTLTIGYGHTNSAKHPLKIKQGLRVTEEQADHMLDVDLDECEEAVNDLVTGPMTQGQFDALTSFAFNCGTGNAKNIIKRLNKGDHRGARAAFDLYVKSKGQTLRGLQRRRDGEQALWDADIPPVIPTEVVDHPAEVDAPPKPTTKELTKVSRKGTWLQNARRLWNGVTLTSILAALGIVNDTSGQVSQFVSWPVLVTLITIGLLAVPFIKYLEALLREDVEEGRYTPSGEVEAA